MGAEPYAGMTGLAIVQAQRQGQRLGKPALASDKMYDVMQRCWRLLPDKRPSFRAINKRLEVIAGLQRNDSVTSRASYLSIGPADEDCFEDKAFGVSKDAFPRTSNPLYESGGGGGGGGAAAYEDPAMLALRVPRVPNPMYEGSVLDDEHGKGGKAEDFWAAEDDMASKSDTIKRKANALYGNSFRSSNGGDGDGGDDKSLKGRGGGGRDGSQSDAESIYYSSIDRSTSTAGTDVGLLHPYAVLSEGGGDAADSSADAGFYAAGLGGSGSESGYGVFVPADIDVPAEASGGVADNGAHVMSSFYALPAGED